MINFGYPPWGDDVSKGSEYLLLVSNEPRITEIIKFEGNDKF